MELAPLQAVGPWGWLMHLALPQQSICSRQGGGHVGRRWLAEAGPSPSRVATTVQQMAVSGMQAAHGLFGQAGMLDRGSPKLSFFLQALLDWVPML